MAKVSQMAKIKYIRGAIPDHGQGLQLGTPVLDADGKMMGKVIGGEVGDEFIWAEIELDEEMELIFLAKEDISCSTKTE